MGKLVIGLDFGTDSCRAIIMDTVTGKELATHASLYPRWKKGLYIDASKSLYRQHPLDYIESMEDVIRNLIKKISPDEIQMISAIGIDTTGSTPCLTDKDGTPLAMLPEYAEDPDAMFILWKDHTSIQEAYEINELSRGWHTDYTSLSGGTYSSEWFWAKGLHALRYNEKIRKDAYSLIEHCDWMPALLTGNLNPEKVKRSRCAAGHKCMWAEEWKGYPDQEFLSTLDTLFDGFSSHMSSQTFTSDTSAGEITKEWSERLGLPQSVVVSVGIIDAHAGAIGAEIKANEMVKIIGTSTCDIIVAPKNDIKDKMISGISGQVNGSVLPQLIGLEAGQSAFGDIYAWLSNFLSWTLGLLPDEHDKDTIISQILPRLTDEAEKIKVTENDIVACDWFNGRRTPFADQTLKGGIAGLTLGTSPAHMYKSLVEATAFGSREIMEHFQKEGVKITEVIGVGGISFKSSYVMQTLSDIMGIPIRVAATQQAGALGVAMVAAVSAGIFRNVEEAQDTLGQGIKDIYIPRTEYSEIYGKLYSRYKTLGKFLSN